VKAEEVAADARQQLAVDSLQPVDAYLAVVSKREVRNYAERPLGAEAERRILEAGRLAGSGSNRQGRRFVVLRDPALVEEAAQSVYAPGNVRGAALAVAIVTGGKGPTAFDAGRAAQNMMLAASNEGIGSCPNGVADTTRLQAAVGHGDEERVATVLTFGYPARPRDPERRSADEWIARANRKPFEEVVEER
jgi:nitroreductase